MDTPADLWLLILGIDTALIGAVATTIAIVRRKQRDSALLYFGLSALIYGVRLVMEVTLVTPDAGPSDTTLFSIAFLSYLVPIPLTGFLFTVFGRGVGDSVLWAFRFTWGLALVGIPYELITGVPFSFMAVNNLFVVAWSLIMVLNTPSILRSGRRESLLVLLGFAVFGLFAVNDNLVALGLMPWAWEGEEVGYVIFLAALGYVAIDRFFRSESRLHAIQMEMDIAREIQTSILPQHLPEVEGLKMAARYRPMSSVAGDFYDVVARDGEDVCILVADVSGHGVGAALIASMLKVAFNEQAHHFSQPARVLDGINQAIRWKLESAFVTAVCFTIDPRTGTMRYSSAGHPPLLTHNRAGGEVTEHHGEGLVLGPFPDEVYTDRVVTLQPGDRIVACTDGILEAENAAGEQFGKDPLYEVIRRGTELAPDAFSNHLLDAVGSWTPRGIGASMEDDVTLVVVDWR